MPEAKVNAIKFTLALEKYRITGENIYSFDEKRLMIEVDVTSAQVITLGERISKKNNKNKSR